MLVDQSSVVGHLTAQRDDLFDVNRYVHLAQHSRAGGDVVVRLLEQLLADPLPRYVGVDLWDLADRLEVTFERGPVFDVREQQRPARFGEIDRGTDQSIIAGQMIGHRHHRIRVEHSLGGQVGLGMRQYQYGRRRELREHVQIRAQAIFPPPSRVAQVAIGADQIGRRPINQRKQFTDAFVLVGRHDLPGYRLHAVAMLREHLEKAANPPGECARSSFVQIGHHHHRADWQRPILKRHLGRRLEHTFKLVDIRHGRSA